MNAITNYTVNCFHFVSELQFYRIKMVKNYLVNSSKAALSRRRVKNFIIWKSAIGEIQDCGAFNTKYCLDRYNLGHQEHKKKITSMIKNIRTIGYIFKAADNNRSPRPRKKVDGRRIKRMPYHDDSPTRESMEDLGFDLTQRLGRGNFPIIYIPPMFVSGILAVW